MNRKKFLKSLQALTGWRESAFMLCLAERALPNAVLFLDSTNTLELDGQRYPKGLLSLMDQSWDALIVQRQEDVIIDCLDNVVAQMHQEEGQDQYGILPTNDCLGIWEQALVSGLNRDKKRALDMSQLSLETITQFLEFSVGDDIDENALIKLFDTHDLVKREFSFQEEAADMLRAAQSPSTAFIKGFRALAADDGVSNIGVSIE
jgi:hypothetical protein